MPTPLKHLLGGLVPAREWLTMAQLAEHGRFPSSEAARHWVRRQKDLPVARRGRHLLVDRAVFDRYVLEQGQPRGKSSRALTSAFDRTPQPAKRSTTK